MADSAVVSSVQHWLRKQFKVSIFEWWFAKRRSDECADRNAQSYALGDSDSENDAKNARIDFPTALQPRRTSDNWVDGKQDKQVNADGVIVHKFTLVAPALQAIIECSLGGRPEQARCGI